MDPLFSISYSIPYLIFLGLLILLDVFYNHRDSKSILNFKDFRLVILALFSIFWGFRGYICTDWVNYYTVFQNCPPLYDFQNWVKYGNTNFIDIGFLVYIGIFKVLTTNYLLFQCSIYLIILYFLDKCIILYSTDYILSFIMVIVFFTVQSINTVRNGIAIMLFVYSIKFIYENKPAKYFLFNLIGLCFHKTAIIFIVLYYIIRHRFNVKLLIVVFAICYVIMIFQISFISQYAENIIGDTSGRINYALQYLKNTSFKLLSIGNIERLITTILLLKNYNKLWDNYRFGGYFSNIMVLYLASNLILFEISTVAVRISQLFSFAYVIFYPYILDLYSKSKFRLLYKSAIIGYVCIWTSMTFGQLMYQYDNFLSGQHKTYEERMILYNYYGASKYVGMN